MKTISFALTTLMTMQAMAAMDITTARGEKTTTQMSPNGKAELCIIPQKIASAKRFSKSDIEDEATLCGMSFYDTMPVCAKQNSTNPGLLIMKPVKGMAKAEVEKTMCAGPNEKLKTEAKFKQSISCSYTPSILAYYQFSRLLDAGRVPVAVLRTMDRKEHARHTALALTYKLGDTIDLTWKSFGKAHENVSNMNIFDNTKDFVYGSLVDNIKKEEQYVEVSGRGSYETRYERFMKQAPFLRVANSNTIEKIADGTTFEQVAQTVVQMKDVSDMILLDTMLSQDDRIGNIHYKYAWYFIDAEGKVERKKSDAEMEDGKWVIPHEELEKYKGKATFVREMILKDNDCGVDVDKRSNKMREISAIEQVRHMNAKTYSRFVKFAKNVENADVESYMKRELLFKDQDLKGHKRSFQSNVKRALHVLNENCVKGKLQLDLNLEDFVPGAVKTKMGCDGEEIK